MKFLRVSLIFITLILFSLLFVYGAFEFPNNQAQTGWMNMSGNVLLLHFNNESAYGENETLAFDFSGNGNNVTIDDGAFFNASEYIRGAFYFDGDDDATVRKHISLNITNFTVMAWFKSSNDFAPTANDWTILSKGTGVSNYNYHLDIQKGEIARVLFTSAAWTYNITYYNVTSLTANTWHHIAGTYNTSSGNLTLYIDGVPVNSTINTGKIPEKVDSFFTIGSTGGSQYFNGSIDEVAVWNITLSPSQIKSIYVNQSMQTPYFQINTPTNSTYVDYRYYGTNKSALLNFTVYDNNLMGINVYLRNSTILDDSNSLVCRYNNIANNTIVYCNVTALPIDNSSQNLMLLYRFDNISKYGESGTSVNDFSKNNLDGTSAAGSYPIFNYTGIIGGAHIFDGVNDATGDYWLVGGSANFFNITTNMTWSVWANYKGLASGNIAPFISLVALNSGTYFNAWTLGIYNNNITMSIANNTDYGEYWLNASIGISGLVTPNTWHHYAGTYDYLNKNLSLYVDGELKSSVIAPTGFTPKASNFFATYVGLNSNWNWRQYNGTLDEVAIWNRTLTPQEIKDIAEIKELVNYYWRVNVSDGINSNLSGINTFYYPLCNSSGKTTDNIDCVYRGNKSFTATVDGSTQYYWLDLPDGYNSTRAQSYPVAIWLHYYGVEGMYAFLNPSYSEFKELSRPQGWIVASPQYRGNSWMNSTARSDVNNTINQILSSFNANSSRVHMFGVSMGGGSVLTYTKYNHRQIASVGELVGLTNATQFIYQTTASDLNNSIKGSYGVGDANAWKNFVWVSNITSNKLDGIHDVQVVGDYAYVTSYINDSLSIINISNKANPVILGSVSDSVLLDAAHDVFVDGNWAYVVSYYSDNLAIINITNKSNPVITSTFYNTSDTNFLLNAHGIFVSNDIAYATAHGSDNFAIFNVSNKSAGIGNANLLLGNISHQSLDGAHRPYLVGNYAYVASWNNDSLTVINVSNPSVPTILGTVSDSRLDGAENVIVINNIAYVTYTGQDSNKNGGFTVVNVSNPTNPTIISNITGFFPCAGYEFGVHGLYIVNNYAYVTSHGNASLGIIDISNLSSLSLRDSYINRSLLNGSHNIVISGDYLYSTSRETDYFSIFSINNFTNTLATLNSHSALGNEVFFGGTPVWLFHGATDDVINVSHARNFNVSMKAAGNIINYTENATLGHTNEVMNGGYYQKLFDFWSNYTLTVSKVNITKISPTGGSYNHQQNTSKNYTFQVCCYDKYCGDVNVSLGYNSNFTTILQDANTENLKDTYTDAFCCPDRSDNNYGTSSQLWIGALDSNVIYISFNISEFSNPLTTIDDAKLYLYLSTADTTNKLGNVSVHHVYADWKNGTGNNILGETDLTYNNQPCGTSFNNDTNCNLSNSINQSINSSETGQWYVWNITDYVRKDSLNGNKNISLALKVITAQTGFKLRFTSKEGTAANRPYLNVTYRRVIGSNTAIFSTNESNPRNITLNYNECKNVTFWVNATGDTGTSYNFFAYANLTTVTGINNITDTFEVNITLGQQSYLQNISQGFNIGNIPSRTGSLTRLINENTILSTLINRVFLGIRAFLESFALFNVLSKFFVGLRTTNDNIGLNNYVLRTLGLTRSIDNNMLINIYDTRNYASYRGLLDAINEGIYADRKTSNNIITFNYLTIDGRTLSNNYFGRSLINLLTLNIFSDRKLLSTANINQGLTINGYLYSSLSSIRQSLLFISLRDSSEKSYILTRGTNLPLILNDYNSKIYFGFRSLYDSLFINNYLYDYSFLFRNQIQSFNINSLLERKTFNTILTFNTITIDGTSIRQIFFQRSLIDQIIMNLFFDYGTVDVGILNERNISDTFLIDNTVTRTFGGLRNNLLSLTLSDYLAKNTFLNKYINQQITILDYQSKTFYTLKGIYNSLTIQDYLSKSQSSIRNPLQSILFDITAGRKTFNTILTFNTITIDGTNIRQIFFQRSLIDQIIMNLFFDYGTLDIGEINEIIISDTVPIIDASSNEIIRIRSILSSIGIIDYNLRKTFNTILTFNTITIDGTNIRQIFFQRSLIDQIIMNLFQGYESIDVLNNFTINVFDIIHFYDGKYNVILNDPTNDILNDISFGDENENIGFEIMFNISKIPKDATINEVLFCDYINISWNQSGTLDNDVNFSWVNDTSWKEDISWDWRLVEIKGQQMLYETTGNWTNLTLGATNCVDVTSVFIQSFIYYDNLTLRFTDPDYPINYDIGYRNALPGSSPNQPNQNGLIVGRYSFGSGKNYIQMQDRNNKFPGNPYPYLSISYETGYSPTNILLSFTRENIFLLTLSDYLAKNTFLNKYINQQITILDYQSKTFYTLKGIYNSLTIQDYLSKSQSSIRNPLQSILFDITAGRKTFNTILTFNTITIDGTNIRQIFFQRSLIDQIIMNLFQGYEVVPFSGSIHTRNITEQFSLGSSISHGFIRIRGITQEFNLNILAERVNGIFLRNIYQGVTAWLDLLWPGGVSEGGSGGNTLSVICYKSEEGECVQQIVHFGECPNYYFKTEKDCLDYLTTEELIPDGIIKYLYKLGKGIYPSKPVYGGIIMLIFSFLLVIGIIVIFYNALLSFYASIKRNSKKVKTKNY